MVSRTFNIDSSLNGSCKVFIPRLLLLLSYCPRKWDETIQGLELGSQSRLVWIGQFWWWSRDITLTLLLMGIWSTMAAKIMQIDPKLLKIDTKKDQIIDCTPRCLTNYTQYKWDKYQKEQRTTQKIQTGGFVLLGTKYLKFTPHQQHHQQQQQCVCEYISTLHPAAAC